MSGQLFWKIALDLANCSSTRAGSHAHTLFRLIKEVAYYKKEVGDNEVQLQAMRDAQQDPYDIKKFQEVLGESQMMVPDSERRLQKALEELEECVRSTSATGKWLETANDILEENAREDVADVVPTTNVDDLADREAF